ncbi:MAG: hypothetical protein MZU91_14735 [Desulfosudis oleivorans]|nr:hypothetical protein [Desulfosudis oleivorans]
MPGTAGGEDPHGRSAAALNALANRSGIAARAAAVANGHHPAAQVLPQILMNRLKNDFSRRLAQPGSLPSSMDPAMARCTWLSTRPGSTVHSAEIMDGIRQRLDRSAEGRRGVVDATQNPVRDFKPGLLADRSAASVDEPSGKEQKDRAERPSGRMPDSAASALVDWRRSSTRPPCSARPALRGLPSRQSKRRADPMRFMCPPAVRPTLPGTAR